MYNVEQLQKKAVTFNNSTREFFKKEISKGLETQDNQEVDTIIDKLKDIKADSIDASIINKINSMFNEKVRIDYKNIINK
jgi:uncharacterized protein (DUF2267 family)